MSSWKLGASEKRLIPGGPLKGPTPWLIAIMTFVMMLVAAAGLAVSGAAGRLETASADDYVLQLPGGAAQSEELATAARELNGVGRADAVPTETIEQDLARWLGPTAEEAGLPIPAMVEVQLAPGTDPERIEEAIQQDFEDAALTSSQAALGPLIGSLRTLAWLALGLVLLVGLAAGAAVVLATRASLSANKRTIAVMHGMGATDTQVASLFQRRMMVEALSGALLGAGAAGLLLILIAGVGAIGGQWLAGVAPLGLFAILALALLPFIAAFIATAVARGAVMQALRAAP
ncbi:hypothetical protein [Sphingomicrobium clamense]|uniref:Cell division protein FtsX n=1 Tax=Sphingomicrobium clamense TaxID=2851013 RepID=A0ABS6V2X2_9SPHN|nr:hypothetical protein [Sphingomicrobium sp. B8]MBW0143912.1 hypothetical protein [Sphingomicrobium sp. B8]